MVKRLATYIFIVAALSVRSGTANGAAQLRSVDIGTTINNMIVDPNRPFIYALDTENNNLLFIDISGSPDGNSESPKEIFVGSQPVDLDIDSSGDILFVASSGGTEIAVVDLNSQTKTDSIFVDFSPISLKTGRQGRLYYATSENPPNIRIVDTVNKEDTGIVVGAADSGGFIVTSHGDSAYMQGADNTKRYDISTDTPSEIDSAQFTSQETFLLSPDETKLFHGELAFNALDLSQVLGSFNETIYAITPVCVANATGRPQANLAFGRNDIHNAQTFTVIEPMPIQSTVLAVSNDGTKLYAFDPSNDKIEVFSLLPSLVLSVGASSPSDTNELNDASDVPMLQIHLAASILDLSVANGISITSITFSASGTGDDLNDVSAVNLIKDVNGNGAYDDGTDILLGAHTFDADDGDVSFAVDEVVSAGSSTDWLITYSFAGAADDLDTFSLSINANTDITASQSALEGEITSHRITQNLTEKKKVFCAILCDSVANTLNFSEQATITGAPVSGATKTIRSVGSLSVTTGANNPSDTNERRDATAVAMQQLTLTASSAADVTVNSITFSASGTGDDSVAISLVRLYEDEDANGILDIETDALIASSNPAYGSDDGEVTFDELNERIGAGESVDWLVVYDFAGTADDFETFAVHVNEGAASATEASHGQEITSVGSTDGATKTIRSLGSLSVSTGANNPPNSNERTDAADVPMQQLTLSASSAADVTVNSLTLSASGTGDDSVAISRAGLYKDENSNGILDSETDTLIASSNPAYDSDDGEITFDELNETISAGENVDWLVVYDFAGTAEDFETFAVRVNEEAVSATEASYGQEITSVGSADGATKTIRSLGSLSVAAGANNPANSNELSGATDVPMQQLTLSAGSAADVTVNSITFSASGTGDDSVAISLVRLYKDEDGDGIFDSEADTLIASSNQAYDADDGEITFDELSEQISAGESVDWLVVYDFAGAADDYETFAVHVNEEAVSATEASFGQEITSVGWADGPIKTIRSPGSLSVSTGPNNPQNTKERPDAAGVPMQQITLTAGSAADIVVNSITLNGAATGDNIADISLINLYNDVDGNGIFDDGTDILLGSGTFGVNSHRITQNFTEWASLGRGAGGQGRRGAGGQGCSGAGGQGSRGAGGHGSRGAGGKEWKVGKRENEKVRAFSHFLGLPVRSSALPAPTITFDELNETVSAGTSVDWLVTYDFSGNADDFTTFSVRIIEGATTCTESSFGETISSVGSARGATKTIVSLGSLTISNGPNNPNDGNASMGADGVPVLQITLSASDSEGITVEEITLIASGTVEDNNNISALNLYKDVNSNGVVDPRHDILLGTVDGIPTTGVGSASRGKTAEEQGGRGAGEQGSRGAEEQGGC